MTRRLPAIEPLPSIDEGDWHALTLWLQRVVDRINGNRRKFNEVHAQDIDEAKKITDCWTVNDECDLIPRQLGRAIGGIAEGEFSPQYVMLQNEDGDVAGGLATIKGDDGGYVVLFGANREGIENSTANRGLKNAGSGIYLDSRGQVAYGLPLGTSPADIEEHYAKFGTFFTAADGRDYVTIARGPKIVYSRVETASDANDYQLLDGVDTTVVVPPLTLANDYSDPASAFFGVLCSEEGDRTASFTCQLLQNGTPLGTPVTFDLSGQQQWISFEYSIGSALTGTQYTLRVTANHTNPNNVTWVRGAEEATVVGMRQLGASPGRSLIDTVYDAGVGPVLTSPNGTKYRIVVDNAGVLSTVVVP